MLERLKCPACCGGGKVAGGSWGHHRGAVGDCLRCHGTGKECDEDYQRRLQSYAKPVAA